MGDETKVQIGAMKKGAEAMGSIVERYLIRVLGPLGKRIQRATKAGRIMALAGIVAVALSGVLIAVNAVSFHTEVKTGVLVVAKPKANLRATASTKSKVVAKVEKGDTLSYISSTDGWYRVRSQGGAGWIAQEMVDRKGNRSLVIEYEMKGYGIVFLAGIALFIAGIVQKKK